MSLLADRAFNLLSYLLIDDESDTLLEGLVRGLLEPAERLSIVAHGDGDTLAPWQAITDPAVAPLWGLPAAAQWTGGVMPAQLAGESDDDFLARARAAVVHPRGMLRGSARSLTLIAQGYLTGTKTVTILNQLSGDLWTVGVEVFEAEVTDLDAMTAALNDNAVIIAGMIASVEYKDPDTPWTLAEMENAYFYRTLADLEGDFADLADLESDTPI
jgi:hypothetical protein